MRYGLLAGQIKGAALLLILGAALLSSTQRSAAHVFDQVIVFGDSNVDSGYYKLLSNPDGGATYNSLWASAVVAGAGAPTTNPGPVNSQILADFFGLSANPANTQGGTNYATSGAKNVTANDSQTGGFTAAIPTVTQISNYLTANGGKANPRALYFIHSGDNDGEPPRQDGRMAAPRDQT
jgi:outer membrane lipase/esterase